MYKKFESFNNIDIPHVVNVRKAELNKRGISDFMEWKSIPESLYIGRNMSLYIPGATGSKWRNPFPAKQYGHDECLRLYKEYILNNKELLDSLDELEGKELGCWCHPNPCHGDILVELFKKKFL